MPALTGLARAAILGRVGPRYGPELIVNGGFETLGAGGADVFANWTETATDGAIAAEAVSVHGGSRAAKLTAGASHSASVSQLCAVTPGGTYAAILWSRGEGSVAGRYVVNDASHGYAAIIAATATGVPGVVYQQVSFTFVAPADCVSAQLLCYCPNIDGPSAYFDDVSIRQRLDIPLV